MSDARIMELVEQAVGYRGHVTVERRDGSRIVGFVYDSAAAHIEMFDERATDRIRVAHAEIANITLSGEDSAAKAQRIWERRRDSLESRETSVWGDWEERPTLILVALPIELRGIAPVLGSSVIARAVGVGGGATHVVAAERPRLVISCGFSGALHASLGPGDLVLASSVRDESGETVAARESVLRITRRALDGRARVHNEQVNEAVESDPDIRATVEALERQADAEEITDAPRRAAAVGWAEAIGYDPVDRHVFFEFKLGYALATTYDEGPKRERWRAASAAS